MCGLDYGWKGAECQGTELFPFHYLLLSFLFVCLAFSLFALGFGLFSLWHSYLAFQSRQIFVVTLMLSSLGIVFEMFALLARISCYLTNRVTCENLLEFDSLTIGSLLLFTTFPILNISLTWLQIAYQTKYLRSTGSSSLTVRIRRFLLVYYGVELLLVILLEGEMEYE